MSNVVVLIVTHNAPSALATCVRRVSAELTAGDRVLVVDNASARPAVDVLARQGLLGPSVACLRLERNLGPAGGYARGLRAFLETGGDLVWILDDDMWPDQGALAVLRETVGRGDGIVAFPTVTDLSGGDWHHPAWCGVLIPREVVAHVGVPREEFVWWVEDTEYLQWRIPRAGYQVLRVDGARVSHGAVRRSRTKPAWKYYYETRNTIYFRFHVQLKGGEPACRIAQRVLRTVVRAVARIATYEDDKAAKLHAVLLGLRDGASQNLGARFPLETTGQ